MPDLRLIRTAFFVLLTHQLPAQTESENEGFSVVRQDEKIIMYERWRPFPGTTTSSREIKCVFHVNTSLENMLAHVYEEGKVSSWQKNLIEYKISNKKDSAWVIYSHYKIPWPLTNQDYLLSYSLSKKDENQIVLSFKHVVDDKLQAVREGVDRKPTVGKWEFEKLANGKIKVTYIITSLPVNFPRVVTDGIVRNNIMNTINTLITVAEK